MNGRRGGVYCNLLYARVKIANVTTFPFFFDFEVRRRYFTCSLVADDLNSHLALYPFAPFYPGCVNNVWRVNKFQIVSGYSFFAPSSSVHATSKT